jgi:phosphohistidine phosphatase
MARQLWLLRHADAEPHGTRPDSERRLTARGERQAQVINVALARMAVEFQVVLVSPKVRARHTAELALERSGPGHGTEIQIHPPLAGGFQVAEALDALAQSSAGAHILLVGHEPDLSGVAAALTGARLDLKKGGLAVLRTDGASGELILLMRPRELALLAGESGLDV